jgi:hypothetical protein
VCRIEYREDIRRSLCFLQGDMASDNEIDDDIVIRFTLDSETERRHDRFNAVGTELTVRLLPPTVGGNSDAITHFQTSVNDLLITH